MSKLNSHSILRSSEQYCDETPQGTVTTQPQRLENDRASYGATQSTDRDAKENHKISKFHCCEAKTCYIASGAVAGAVIGGSVCGICGLANSFALFSLSQPGAVTGLTLGYSALGSAICAPICAVSTWLNVS